MGIETTPFDAARYLTDRADQEMRRTEFGNKDRACNLRRAA